MEFLSSIYNLIFFQPLLNGLILLSNYMPNYDLGLAIISLTVIVRIILFPFSHHGAVTQIKMRELEPKLKEIREKFKDKKEEQAKKTMELYKSHGLNPLSGCVLALVQIPILIALWKVFITGIALNNLPLYSFVAVPPEIQTSFLGLINLKEPSVILGAIAALLQFVQMKLMMPKTEKIEKAASKPDFQQELSRAMSTQMTYVLPFIILFISFKFSAAIPLYWITFTVFAIIHETRVRKSVQKIYGGEQNKNFKSDSGIS